MKIIKKNQTEKFKNSDSCFATEYRFKDDNTIDGALVEISGRYPDKGRVVNLECKEMAYVLNGLGKIFIDDKEIQLAEEDLILIEPGEKYFWEGKLIMFVSCIPAWQADQHKKVE